MKVILFTVLTIASVFGEDGFYQQDCTPGTTFHKQCNVCTCTKTGLQVCTKMNCPPGIYSENGDLMGPVMFPEQVSKKVYQLECEKNAVFKDDCNICVCSNTGKSALCTNEICITSYSYDSDRLTRSPNTKPTCVPGKIYNIECNACKCDKSRENPTCTSMRCISGVNYKTDSEGPNKLVKRDTTESETGYRCTPGKTFKQDCNTCICDKTGTHALCTLQFCLPGLASEHEIEKENSLPLEETYEQGTPCNPEDIFYDDCNLCICGSDGKSASCTYQLCN